MKSISNKKLLISFIILLVLNSISLKVLSNQYGVDNLDGTYSKAGSPEIIRGLLIALLLIFPIIISFFSALIALFQNKNKAYGKRFLRTYLYFLIIVYTLAFIRFTMNIFTA